MLKHRFLLIKRRLTKASRVGSAVFGAFRIAHESRGTMKRPTRWSTTTAHLWDVDSTARYSTTTSSTQWSSAATANTSISTTTQSTGLFALLVVRQHRRVFQHVGQDAEPNLTSTDVNVTQMSTTPISIGSGYIPHLIQIFNFKFEYSSSNLTCMFMLSSASIRTPR